jgi:hypothetical protein
MKAKVGLDLELGKWTLGVWSLFFTPTSIRKRLLDANSKNQLILTHPADGSGFNDLISKVNKKNDYE